MKMTRFDVIYRKSLLSSIFKKGWGSPDLLVRLIKNRTRLASPDAYYTFVDPFYPIKIEKSKESKDVVVMDGSFVSPFDELFPGAMRGDCRKAKFQMILPKNWRHNLRPVCIHLAGTGDHHYFRRRLFLANRLLKDGIGSIILMNPFYGDRKPKDQTMSNLNYLSDLFVMGGSLMLECQALLYWCERHNYGPLALHGISMGGYMASLAASVWPRPISLVPCLSWTTASTAYLDGVLSDSICWDTLTRQYLQDKAYSRDVRPLLQPSIPDRYRVPEAAQAPELEQPAYLQALHATPVLQQQVQSQQQRSYSTGPLGRLGALRYEALASQLDRLRSALSRQANPSADTLAAMDVVEQRLLASRPPRPHSRGSLDREVEGFFREILDVFTHMGNYNRPYDPELVVNVVAEYDSYIPRTGVVSLEEVWPGMRLEVLQEVGHIGAYLRSSVWTQDLFRQAIRDSLNLQVEKYMGQPGPF